MRKRTLWSLSGALIAAAGGGWKVYSMNSISFSVLPEQLLQQLKPSPRMPVMFLGIFNNYASGLSYYYLLANLFTFAQMWFIRRTINEEKLLQRLQENKKKPAKKSGFQRRLEEMAKQQGYNKK